MSIIVKNNHFHLKTKTTSYVMGVYNDKYLMHHYWGKVLNNDVDLSYVPEERIYARANAFHVPGNEDSSLFVSDFQYEFSVVGGGDYRTPTLAAICPDGSPVIELEYNGYKLIEGKPGLEGLPAVYSESGDKVDSLEIELYDKKIGLKAYLTYTVFEDYDAIIRSIRYENTGAESIKLTSAQSFSVDMPGRNYNILHLHGDWIRERKTEYLKVPMGNFSIDSKRGMSSHMHNPFVALLRDNADENYGDVYAFSLVYSGSFIADVNADSCGGTRVSMGINHCNFEWELKAGDTFQTPEAVLVYSDSGLSKMSHKYHKLYRERLCRGKWRDLPRPMVINNWEGTSFNFNEEALLDIAKNGAKAGLEMFVLDDGWFGNRNDDHSSMGDWTVHAGKLPHGLGYLADEINKMGMKFGLWFEPEMVSPDSELYRKHPDWCIHSEGRRRTENRWELVLDLSREEVRDHVVDAVSNILKSANIEYVKWDCNRNITETASTEQAHRYVLGLYDIMERLVTAFPDVLFESCSGGGGRFDPGMLYYMPQTWTSDQTAPVPRMSIQTGTSFVYPASSMVAHVASSVTKRPMGDRKDAFNTAAYVSMAGNFGLEMDLRKLSDEELEQAKRYVEEYREIRNTVQFGEMYRLESCTEHGDYSFQFNDDEQTVIFTYQTETGTNSTKRRVYPKGLDKDAKYTCNGQTYYGEELMNLGFNIRRDKDEKAAFKFVFKKN